MNKFLIVLVSTFLISISPMLNAFSLISAEKTVGTIKSVNAENNELIVQEDKSGELHTFTFTDNVVVVVGDVKYSNLDLLEEGQKVAVKVRRKSPVSAPIEGEVLRVNKSNYTAKIREDNSGEILEVEFDETVQVTGLVEGGFKKLDKGQQVRLQYLN